MSELISPRKDIRRLMDVNNMNQTELAEAIGMSPQYISDFLRGNKNLSCELAIRIGREFGYDLRGIPYLWMKHELSHKYESKRHKLKEANDE